MPEVTHIAVIQISGLTGAPHGATRSRAFSSLNDALGWVGDVVEQAHGHRVVSEDLTIVDRQSNVRSAIWHIVSLDGPAHGWIIPVV